jgi:hypothetical protein
MLIESLKCIDERSKITVEQFHNFRFFRGNHLEALLAIFA